MIYPDIDIDQLKTLQEIARSGCDEMWYKELYKIIKIWLKYAERDKKRESQKLSEEDALSLLNQCKTELSQECQELSCESESNELSGKDLLLKELSSCKCTYEQIVSQVLGTAISAHQYDNIEKSYIDLIKYILEKAENFEIFEKPPVEEFKYPKDPIYNLMSLKPKKKIIKLVRNFVKEHSDWSKISHPSVDSIKERISCCIGYANEILDYNYLSDDMYFIISVIYDESSIAGSLIY